MNEIEKKQKIFGLVLDKNKYKIAVTHVTIRQSIFFLVLKLLFLEIVTTLCIIIVHTLLFSPHVIPQISETIRQLNIPLLLVLISLKTIAMIYIILEWLEEYYEITPEQVIHKKGFIFRREERYSLKHLERLHVQQGIFGRIFNFGSVKMYDWVLGKDIQLYLIHNPMKYHAILKTILPEADQEKTIVREHILEEADSTF